MNNFNFYDQHGSAFSVEPSDVIRTFDLEISPGFGDAMMIGYCMTSGPEFKKPKKFIPPGKKDSEEQLIGLNDEVHGGIIYEPTPEWLEEWQRLIAENLGTGGYNNIQPIWIYDPDSQPQYGNSGTITDPNCVELTTTDIKTGTYTLTTDYTGVICQSGQ